MAEPKINKQYYCEKCGRTMTGDSFYSSNNLEKYPNDGKFPICKKCMTMRVDNWNPETYLWILQEADVPYIPDEWNKLLQSYGRSTKKLTGMTILGRYLSKMKLKQFGEYRWKDTEHLQQVMKSRIEQTMKDAGYSRADIDEALEKAIQPIPENPTPPPKLDDITPEQLGIVRAPDNPFVASAEEDYFAKDIPAQTAEELGLTEEDQTYLRLKWGKSYKPEEWVKLEQLYSEMMESYDIQSAGHIDTLKLICKASLKANQLIDIGDIEGFQKISKVYDSLMKSGKFTAAQNKAEGGEYIDAIGELVMICEKEGFIPRYYIGEPNDKVDQTLLDMKRYTYTLITEETNLSALIEEAVKNNQKEDAAEAEADDTDINYGEDDVIKEIESTLQDSDFEEYSEFLDNEALSDAELLNFLTQEDKL